MVFLVWLFGKVKNLPLFVGCGIGGSHAAFGITGLNS